ncbi:response regulator [Tumidithrix elongata RA019]|uniref:Response regulator n=1 Tax=Tumidithrix elongata BACA0141 TaxID=2716417 RepID=A0AAW9Q1V6_9CYAN|nr:response regulator [Tumidithrix elongata RA019]
MKILLVEDDEVLITVLTKSLTAQHYIVDVVKDGETGWTYGATFEYDLILLDIMLPKLDGIRLCQRFRAEGYTTPILLLTAQNSCTAKVNGLDAGADDYVVKPFDAPELIARIRALLRRSQVNSFPLLTWGDLLLNPSTCEVSYNSQPLTLTNKEYELLELMMRDSQHLLSADEILDRLWSSDEFPSEATVRSHIRRLRQKLVAVGAPADFITTVHGRGYCLKAQEPQGEDPSEVTTSSEMEPLNPLSEVTGIIGDRSSEQQAQYLAFLNQLWSTSKSQCLEQLGILLHVLQSLQSGTCNQQLQTQAQQTAHKLAGTLGTLGLTLGMQLAHQLEGLLGSQLPMPVQRVEMLSALLLALEQAIQNTNSIHHAPAAAIASIAPSSSPVGDSNMGTKVMIVDDDIEYLRSLPQLLEPWGFSVTTLADPLEFWSVLEAMSPDVLVLDVNMPQINGIELCQALRNNLTWRRLPVLFLSIMTDMNTQNLAFSAGADDYLCKPVVGKDLANRILNRLKRVSAWVESY